MALAGYLLPPFQSTRKVNTANSEARRPRLAPAAIRLWMLSYSEEVRLGDRHLRPHSSMSGQKADLNKLIKMIKMNDVGLKYTK